MGTWSGPPPQKKKSALLLGPRDTISPHAGPGQGVTGIGTSRPFLLSGHFLLAEVSGICVSTAPKPQSLCAPFGIHPSQDCLKHQAWLTLAHNF